MRSAKYTGDTTRDSPDVYASGPFELFGREHELLIGQSVSTSQWKGKDFRPTDWAQFAIVSAHWRALLHDFAAVDQEQKNGSGR
ncbi:outer membrane receptor for ferric coprogen and ferric-rhodotorulic acid [Pseudomonas sp. JAI120]|jgi:outer membrane receptor for ferric coprogen and ferric-rhodotorulic acid|nr:outer membrane receptor for ferric coprogen and ferric-rhodotorulic acid [Pseudomonas sp. SJZ073]MBB6316080.1 outer membrane receptor for ferric coprogen and ferric-rhodotorulic acid [Pseudomonas sp. JAI120]